MIMDRSLPITPDNRRAFTSLAAMLADPLTKISFTSPTETVVTSPALDAIARAADRIAGVTFLLIDSNLHYIEII